MFYTLAKNLRHASPQNRFTFKEFETTTREKLALRKNQTSNFT